MTEEDKQLIAAYMGWKFSEWRMIDGSTHVVNPHFFDLNDAGLCVQEIQKRGSIFEFYMHLIDVYNGLIEDGKEICGADNFTVWLFNAANFFNAMSEWLKEGKK